MDIYSNPKTANIILTLENDRKFTDEMEVLAYQIAPSLFKTRKFTDARPFPVILFSWNQFLSYSICEKLQGIVSDKIRGSLNKERVNVPYDGSLCLVKDSLIKYYLSEIKLGNFCITHKEDLICHDIYTAKLSKAAASRKHDISPYKLNKTLEKWTQEAYSNLCKVRARQPYQEVMNYAKNADQPEKSYQTIENNA